MKKKTNGKHFDAQQYFHICIRSMHMSFVFGTHRLQPKNVRFVQIFARSWKWNQNTKTTGVSKISHCCAAVDLFLFIDSTFRRHSGSTLGFVFAVSVCACAQYLEQFRTTTTTTAMKKKTPERHSQYTVCLRPLNDYAIAIMFSPLILSPRREMVQSK